jgi:AAA15 family ATPase/GTPase
MILEFSISNFRSIKEKQTFTLVAEATKSKRESNSFEVESLNKVRLLKSAIMYGANASGKSNFIKALDNLRDFIIFSSQFQAGEPIFLYNPFLFDILTREAATEYVCTFIGYNNIKHEYSISFNRSHVVHEELNYYPKSVKKNLFKRVIDGDDSLSDTATFNVDALKNEQDNALSNSIKVFKNQAILSKFGRDLPHSHLTQTYLYFSKWRIWDTSDTEGINSLIATIINQTIPQKGDRFFARLERLIKATDTKVNGLILKENKESENPRLKPEYTRRAISRLFGKHMVFDSDKIIDYHELPFSQESSGTKILFALGALILDAIETGSAVIFDELDNSLHPKLSRFLVQIFNNEKYNTKNAQIIFSSHEAHLMDKDIFRSDQIWFAEKNEKGATEIYSAQDFEGVREDIPFEKWYLAGKFGAIPQTKEMDYIFNDAQETTNT